MEPNGTLSRIPPYTPGTETTPPFLQAMMAWRNAGGRPVSCIMACLTRSYTPKPSGAWPSMPTASMHASGPRPARHFVEALAHIHLFIIQRDGAASLARFKQPLGGNGRWQSPVRPPKGPRS